jgi:Fic-DOC domain mobile mystery protein B
MKQFEYPYVATLLDPEETAGLKQRHVRTRSELDRWEHENIQDAIAWLEKRRRQEEGMTEQFICQLHEKMFGRVWTWAGTFRRTNKNIGVEWTKIPVELRKLLDDLNYWISHHTYAPEEIAYRFHHRLVWIHLFTNGNGRHSRLIADILLTEVLGLIAFSWGSANLGEAGAVRKQYIQALQAADRDDYSLLQIFVRS